MEHGEPDSRQFEQLLAELQATVEKLEGAELTLSDAIAAYERCVELANACTAILDTAELRVSQARIAGSRMREQPAVYALDPRETQRLLLGEDDDLSDLLDDED